MKSKPLKRTIKANESEIPFKKHVTPELREQANQFLNSYEKHGNNLTEMMNLLHSDDTDSDTNLLVAHALEVIYKNLLKRRDMCATSKAESDTVTKSQNEHDTYVIHYENFWKWLEINLGSTHQPVACAALSTSMNLLALEAKYPLDPKLTNKLPKKRLSHILKGLMSCKNTPSPALLSFQRYANCLDIIEIGWELLTQLGSKQKFANTNYALNYLTIVDALNMNKKVLEEQKYHCSDGTFNEERTRKNINAAWKCVMDWSEGMNVTVHRQVLIALLERFLPHLKEPILLTDFLMDSLNIHGAIGLLALQGIFTLMQKHNITYPDVYEKLYSMFEPGIFKTKFKARLFYLADIFLTSTHLPENLVAAFVKRLARLSLIARPQDCIIICHFIKNLIMRHTGLKRMICAAKPTSVAKDPYDMDEMNPVKSRAIDSSLWEIVLLQKHAIPTVATVARFIHQSLPKIEFDISTVLDTKETELFDAEISKQWKQFPLGYEKPLGFHLAENDLFKKCWKLF